VTLCIKPTIETRKCSEEEKLKQDMQETQEQRGKEKRLNPNLEKTCGTSD
jgi:hypothetical protein